MSFEGLPVATGSGGKAGNVDATCHVVGGGIAGLAAAVFLIRDAGVSGAAIRLYEQSEVFGGSLDGSGSAERGYVVRGARMFEEHFVCTFGLLSSIPSLDHPQRSVKDEIVSFNRQVVSSSRCRLVRDGRKVEAPRLGLDLRDLVDLAVLMLRSERALAGATIETCFRAGFFRTNFWIMWSTMFAFLPWHSAIEFRRYLRRFIHLFPGIKSLEGVLRTRFNQYHELIAPVVAWLRAEGVQFHPGHHVADLDLVCEDGIRRVTALQLLRNGRPETLRIAAGDRVFLTLGSMIDGASLGSTSAPPPQPQSQPQSAAAENGAWELWRKLAARDPAFGNPSVFCGDVAKTQWESFTVTLRRPGFFDFMESFTGNLAGSGGLVTFAESNWLLSIVLFHQPHFRDQPDDAYVFWGNGLFPDRPGNFVDKPMSQSSGREILRELAGHLGLAEDQAERLLGGAITIPCRMPYITSQFMPRAPGDRPPVIPQPGSNFALIGQFAEVPEDVVFTVEYSVRAAMTAVYSLFPVAKAVPAVRPTYRSPTVLLKALTAAVFQ